MGKASQLVQAEFSMNSSSSYAVSSVAKSVKFRRIARGALANSLQCFILYESNLKCNVRLLAEHLKK